MPTSVITVILCPSSISVLALSCPVGHATKLVVLGEWRIGHTFEGGFGGDRGAPSVSGRAALANLNKVDIRHFDVFCMICALKRQ